MLCVPGAWLRTSRPTRLRKHAWPQRAGKHRPRGNKPGSRKRRKSVLRRGESIREPVQTLFLHYRSHNDEAVSDEAASVNEAKANLTPVRAGKHETKNSHSGNPE